MWLKKRALEAVAARTANTFVVCRGKQVVGFYSLATGSVAHVDCTSSLRRNTPDPVPAIVLARLAVTKTEQNAGIGRHLLQDAMKRTLAAAKYVAARTLLVHALTERVAATYKKFGFLPLPVSKDGVVALHLPLGTIAASLSAKPNEEV